MDSSTKITIGVSIVAVLAIAGAAVSYQGWASAVRMQKVQEANQTKLLSDAEAEKNAVLQKEVLLKEETDKANEQIKKLEEEKVKLQKDFDDKIVKTNIVYVEKREHIKKSNVLQLSPEMTELAKAPVACNETGCEVPADGVKEILDNNLRQQQEVERLNALSDLRAGNAKADCEKEAVADVLKLRIDLSDMTIDRDMWKTKWKDSDDYGKALETQLKSEESFRWKEFGIGIAVGVGAAGATVAGLAFGLR